MARSNMIQSQTRRGILGDAWLMKIEKKAFGWQFWSQETEENVELEVTNSGKIRKNSKFIHWLEFRRRSPYTGNILFKLTETLSRIFSFFRRILCSIGIPAMIITLIAGLVLSYGCDAADLGNTILTVTMWLAISYAISIAVTMLFAGLALLWRKAFGIDKKLAEEYGEYVNDLRFKDE